MSAQVFELPDSMQRQWRVVEAVLVDFMARRGCARDAIDHVTSTIKPLFLKYGRAATFSGSGEEVVEALNEWVRNLVSGLVLEIAALELELFNAGMR